MILLNILWPTFALVTLIFAVWSALVVQRARHLKRNPPTSETFASSESAVAYFRPVETPANNLANLFEMPVLYFALVPLLVIAGRADASQITLAWLYVLLRAVHSYIHIVPKTVRPRFLVYLASVMVLSAMWIGFFLDMASAAHAYSAAVTRLGSRP